MYEGRDVIERADEPGWFEGWKAAMEWLAEYNGPVGILLAAEMATRLPEWGRTLNPAPATITAERVGEAWESVNDTRLSPSDRDHLHAMLAASGIEVSR